MGAHCRCGPRVRTAIELLAGLGILTADGAVASQASELGAELIRRGVRPSAADLLIAASVRVHRKVLLTRDRGFAAIPGLAVETY